MVDDRRSHDLGGGSHILGGGSVTLRSGSDACVGSKLKGVGSQIRRDPAEFKPCIYIQHSPAVTV